MAFLVLFSVKTCDFLGTNSLSVHHFLTEKETGKKTKTGARPSWVTGYLKTTLISWYVDWEQWCSDMLESSGRVVVRTLASHQCAWPGFDFQTRRHMWVKFVGSILCSERFFPGYSGFSLSSKTYNSLAERRGSVGCRAFRARGPRFDSRWLKRLFRLFSDPCSYSFKYP